VTAARVAPFDGLSPRTVVPELPLPQYETTAVWADRSAGHHPVVRRLRTRLAAGPGNRTSPETTPHRQV